jgi:hypothetical protein
VLEPTKQAVLKRYGRLKVRNFDPILKGIAKDADGNSLGFHNHSDLDFQKLKGDPDHTGRHLSHYNPYGGYGPLCALDREGNGFTWARWWQSGSEITDIYTITYEVPNIE